MKSTYREEIRRKATLGEDINKQDDALLLSDIELAMDNIYSDIRNILNEFDCKPQNLDIYSIYEKLDSLADNLY